MRDKYLNPLLATAVVAILGMTAVSAKAQATWGIASASPNGTNYPMAQNIVDVCSTPTSKGNNVESAGSVDNLFKVYQDPNAQFGIVQADAAVYQQGLDPQMMKKIMMVFPFFSTEMHLVAKDGSPITSLAQLEGKRVVEGPEGSGTWVSVQVIKKLTGIKWQGFYASQADGMKAVTAGQADAMFVVAGMPVGIIKSTPGIKLLPMTHPSLDSFQLYTKTMIPTGVYPTVKSAVPTYKVDNMLVTFAFKTERQKEIADLVTCITRNIEVLQTAKNADGTPKYHPKWRDVDPLDIDRIKWPAHPAAVAAIKREAKRK
jgi:uncharacterized protein